MIDFVKLRYNIQIPHEYFSPEIWRSGITESGQPYFWHTIRGVDLKYYTFTERFTINGKILMLLHDTQVQNFDDIYGAETEMFLDELNEKLNGLFPCQILDIRDFTVTRIDYCVNVETSSVKEYLEFLTQAFEKVNKGKRVNFTAEKGLHGSVYIKTAAQYEKNERRSYTLNFYDKHDWIEKKQIEWHNISEADQILADQVLRLEIQCGDQMVSRVAEQNNIGRTFRELFNFKIAYVTILRTYSLVFKATEEADYYSYQEAKTAVAGFQGLQTRAKRNALDDLENIAKNHEVTRSRRNNIKALGIYPWCFLAKRGSLAYLENPMKLIRKKLEPLGVFLEE